MRKACQVLGVSRQAYYQYWERQARCHLEEDVILAEVSKVRQLQPKVGVRKLCLHLEEPLRSHGITLGRDALFDLLRRHDLLVRQRKGKKKTTDSNHPFRKYKNLTKDFIPLKANELWVSDITYLDTLEGFVYLFLITDAYSHKILGCHVSDTLEAQGAILALQMALATRTTDHPLIHHSDRGVQYCSTLYIQTLLNQPNPIQISMTHNGDPYENAMAERLNGILKNELIPQVIPSKQAARELIKTIVETYNNIRLHSSVDMLTPTEAHLKTGELKKHWKNNKPKPFAPSEAKVNTDSGAVQEQALKGFWEKISTLLTSGSIFSQKFLHTP